MTMKQLFTSLFVAALVLAGIPPAAPAGVAEAQTAGMNASAPGLPAGFSVFYPDFDRGDDEIAQLFSK